MIEKIRFSPESQEETDDKLKEEFMKYFMQNRPTVDELTKAYLHLWETQSSDSILTEKEEQLLQKMKDLVNRGMAQNTFREWISLLVKYEKAYQDFDEFVDQLGVSKGEARVLRSVRDNRRQGTFEFYMDGESEPFISLSTNKKKRYPVNIEQLIYELVEVFREVGARVPEGQKFNFTFTED